MILNKQLVKNVNKNVSKKKTAVENKKHLKNTFLELQCLSATTSPPKKILKNFCIICFIKDESESKKKTKNIYL